MKNQLTVKEIYIYPVKGLKGISISSCKVTEMGLAHDRVYMIADEDGQLISQRTHVELALMQVQRIENSWKITFKDQDLFIEDDTISVDEIEVEVWGTVFSCNEVSKPASAWFAKQLGMSCKLMKMPNKQTRLKEFNKPPFETYVSFVDGYPITTLGTKSMELLNQKLEVPIKANRFRPNIIIETNTPHEEDLWEDFTIGSRVKLRNIEPCVRCEVVTIDQKSGVKGKEPLSTLATYRRDGEGVCFSSNVITLEEGDIRVGDIVNV